MPAWGLGRDETAGLFSGDAGRGVEGIGDRDGDAPDPETAVSVGVGSGDPAAGGEDEDGLTGEVGAGEGVPKSVEEDGPGLGADAPPHILLCCGQFRVQVPLVTAS